MAGIGFELRKMIDHREGFFARVRAYVCAGLISSGPWIMTILTLSALSAGGPWLGGDENYSAFRALVTYAFAFSLIVQGIGQMAVTRRVADHLYRKEYGKVLPAFVACMIAIALVQAVVGGIFCACAGFSLRLSVVAVSLYVIVSMSWLALIWLSVAREYDEVLRAYVYGMLVSVLALFAIGWFGGTAGMLGAYTAGQAYTLLLLVRTIARGMERGGARDFSVFTSLREFPQLVGVGLAYNAAIWADKMVFWFRDGQPPGSMIRFHPLYDTCCFLAYLTVVPALAVNLVRLETSFYEHYRAYYGSILGGMPLPVIEDKRSRMFENLRESCVRLIRVQGAITILCILFAPQIMRLLEMPDVAARIFRLTALGALFHVLMLITVLMQLYFDLRAQALVSSVAFLLLNTALAIWSVGEGVHSYGIGYAAASFLSLLLAYTLLARSLERLDYYTFTNQPIGETPAKEAHASAEKKPEKKKEEEKSPAPVAAPAAAGVAGAATPPAGPAAPEPPAPVVFATEAGEEPEEEKPDRSPRRFATEAGEEPLPQEEAQQAADSEAPVDAAEIAEPPSPMEPEAAEEIAREAAAPEAFAPDAEPEALPEAASEGALDPEDLDRTLTESGLAKWRAAGPETDAEPEPPVVPPSRAPSPSLSPSPPAAAAEPPPPSRPPEAPAIDSDETKTEV